MRWTPGFIAPETIFFDDQKTADPFLVDIWCFGETVFQALTNSHTFSGLPELNRYQSNATQFPSEALRQASVRNECIDFIECLMRPLPSQRLDTNTARAHSWMILKGDASDGFEITTQSVPGRIDAINLTASISTAESELTQASGQWDDTVIQQNKGANIHHVRSSSTTRQFIPVQQHPPPPPQTQKAGFVESLDRYLPPFSIGSSVSGARGQIHHRDSGSPSDYNPLPAPSSQSGEEGHHIHVPGCFYQSSENNDRSSVPRPLYQSGEESEVKKLEANPEQRLSSQTQYLHVSIQNTGLDIATVRGFAEIKPRLKALDLYKLSVGSVCFSFCLTAL